MLYCIFFYPLKLKSSPHVSSLTMRRAVQKKVEPLPPNHTVASALLSAKGEKQTAEHLQRKELNL